MSRGLRACWCLGRLGPMWLSQWRRELFTSSSFPSPLCSTSLQTADRSHDLILSTVGPSSTCTDAFFRIISTHNLHTRRSLPSNSHANHSITHFNQRRLPASKLLLASSFRALNPVHWVPLVPLYFTRRLLQHLKPLRQASPLSEANANECLLWQPNDDRCPISV